MTTAWTAIAAFCCLISMAWLVLGAFGPAAGFALAAIVFGQLGTRH